MANITFTFATRAELDEQLRNFLGLDRQAEQEADWDTAHAEKMKAEDMLTMAIADRDEVQTEPVKQGPVQETAQSAKEIPAPPAEQSAPAITLENLSTAPWSDLLAFCKANPAIGVDTEKCTAPFFRGLAEVRIKAFLTSK